MGPLDQIRHAGLGWLELILGRDTWRQRFITTIPGLAVALGCYLVMVIANAIVPLILTATPVNYQLVLANILLNAAPLLALWIVIRLTVWMLKPAVTVNDLFVPAVWALTLLLVLRLPLALIPAPLPFGTAILAVLGFLLFRAARHIAGLSATISIAFGLLGVVALVTLSNSLYMVLAPGTGLPI